MAKLACLCDVYQQYKSKSSLIDNLLLLTTLQWQIHGMRFFTSLHASTPNIQGILKCLLSPLLHQHFT